MGLAVLHSRALNGIKSPQITIECHVSGGLPRFLLVGLPEAAVKESKDRVRSALLNAKFKFPASRITVNLAPADCPKEGSRLDLPVALTLLLASNQLETTTIDQYECIGELALSGELRPVKGVLPIALAVKKAGKTLILPKANAAEASIVTGLHYILAEHLLEVCAHLQAKQLLEVHVAQYQMYNNTRTGHDMADVIGQPQARRVLEIAAAGGHSLLMCGPPGTGKTMLASRLGSILPNLSVEEGLEVAALNSISNKGFDVDVWLQRPFRQPHHSISNVALVGGGRPPKPGEISLAHKGVLFLDELPEFKRHVLECLREPLESGTITISRAGIQVDFPADFQLIMAMNPCPCGYLGDTKVACTCTEEQVQRYRQRLSGPLLDRVDCFITVNRLPQAQLIQTNDQNNECSAPIRQRVIDSRQLQLERQGSINGSLSTEQMNQHCKLDSDLQQWLTKVAEQLNLSARAYHRLLKVARTIADLEHSQTVHKSHLQEALTYRNKL